MKKATRIYIYGTVQGTFFRIFVKKNADDLNLKGYVRNKEDGSVEAWFEGDSKDIERMIELCKKGPEHSIIKRLDIIEESLQGLKEFKIINF